MAEDPKRFEARVVEGIFHRGLAGQLTSAARARLRTAGVDLSHPLRPSYPRETLLEAVSVAAEELNPGEPLDAAHRALGRRLVRGWLSSWRGRAAAAAARAVGPERVLAKLLGRIPTPTNFLEAELQRKAPGTYELSLNLGAPHPELIQGILLGLLEVIRARDARVDIVERGPGGERYLIRFAP